MKKDVIARNNVNIQGQGAQPIMFAHGFGCDQVMWRHVAPAFEATHKVVLFDHVGAGKSDLAAYDFTRYATLAAYSDDVLEIISELGLTDVVFVGHSVSAMIGILAANKAPELFARLILVGPSPRYANDVDYHGGFDRQDLEELLDVLDSNFLGWSQQMAPVIMGNPDTPALGEELTNSFCRTDPDIAAQFARVTFLSDNRQDLPHVSVPSLILQCQEDVIAPEVVGRYVHQYTPNSSFVLLDSTGHCPNLSAPEETTLAIRSYLESSPDAA